MLSMKDMVDFWNCECSLETSAEKKPVTDESDLLWDIRHPTLPVLKAGERKMMTPKKRGKKSQ